MWKRDCRIMGKPAVRQQWERRNMQQEPETQQRRGCGPELWIRWNSAEAVMDCLRILERDYPGMNVVIWEREGAADLAQLAAALGKGRFLVVTRDFLDRMGRDAGEYERCRTVLKETACRLAQGGSASVSEGVCLAASGKRTWVVPAAG